MCHCSQKCVHQLTSWVICPTGSGLQEAMRIPITTAKLSMSHGFFPTTDRLSISWFNDGMSSAVDICIHTSYLSIIILGSLMNFCIVTPAIYGASTVARSTTPAPSPHATAESNWQTVQREENRKTYQTVYCYYFRRQ